MKKNERQIIDAFNILQAQTEAEIIECIHTGYISAEIAVQSYPKNKMILCVAYQCSPQAMRYADQSLINELGQAGIIKEADVLKVFSIQKPSPVDLAEKAQQFEDAIANQSWDKAQKLITGFWFECPGHLTKQTIIQNIVKNLNENTSWDVLFQFIKEDQKYTEYLSGPRKKAKETYDLEDLARAMMQYPDFEIIVREEQEFIIFKHWTLFGGWKSTAEFNWTKIIKNANFQDISLKEQDFRRYASYWETYEAKKHSTLSEARQKQYPSLSFAEQQAVFVYSGGGYREINHLMRDKPKIFGMTHQDLRFYLIHAVMCASALTKQDEIPMSSCVCGERGLEFEPNLLEKFVCAAANQDVVQFDGFVSSVYSNTEVTYTTYIAKPIQLYLFNLRGLYIDPISCHPGEQEYLILPTAVRFSNYRQKKNGYVSGMSHYLDVVLLNPLEEHFIPIVWASQHPLLKDVTTEQWVSLIEAGKIDPHAAAFHFSSHQKIILAAYRRNPKILGHLSAKDVLTLAEKKSIAWHDVHSIFSQHPQVMQRYWDRKKNKVVSFFSETFIKNSAHLQLLSTKFIQSLSGRSKEDLEIAVQEKVNGLTLLPHTDFNLQNFPDLNSDGFYNPVFIQILGECLEKQFSNQARPVL